MKKKIAFISIWQQGDGLSGGDRIWIEFAKIWKKQAEISLICSPEAKKISQRYDLKEINYSVVVKPIMSKNNLSVFNLIKNLISRTFQAIRSIKKGEIYKKKFDYIYSTSDFWPDSISSWYLKLKNRNIIWVAGFYLFAPLPWKKDSPYKGKNFLKGLFYLLVQFPIYLLVRQYADIVFVTSEPDVKKFITKRRHRDHIIVIQGGVDISASEKAIRGNKLISVERREFDACFIGRLHFQKGVLGLIDIWREVCNKKTHSKLLMIGDGELEHEIRIKIKKLGLEQNIKMVGFADGKKKFDYIANSKIVLHPATYDSGGMAAAEAMAWRLPGVSFDLEALKTYYPKGMLKTPIGNNREFAKNILKLLDRPKLYDKVAEDAHDLIVTVWDWKKRAIIVYNETFK